MGWSIGFDPAWNRDIGYGVPAQCDHPDCDTGIDRGLSYVCGGAPYGGDYGCGLYFCETHLAYAYTEDGEDDLLVDGKPLPHLCERCIKMHQEGEDSKVQPFTPKPDVPEWINWKLTDESWQQWRDENPERVARLRADPRLAEIQRIIDEHMGDLTARVIDVFDEAPADATAEDVMPDVFAAIGLTASS